MDRVEAFIKDELSRHTALEDAVYGEQRRATERAAREGTVIGLGLLSPNRPEPLKRGKARLSHALAVLSAGKKREKRPNS